MDSHAHYGFLIMWGLSSGLQSNTAALDNREPAVSPGDSTLQDQPLQVVSSALDFSALRATAVPAGSRGKIRIHASDPTKLAEASAPSTEIKMIVAPWAPDATYAPLPTTQAAVTAGVEHLAKCGHNALRLHGIEYWLMAGTSTEFEFPADKLDMFDWLWAEAKRVGLYLIINPRQPELYQAGSSRFTMPETSPEMKSRVFTQQNSRDHYERGFNLLYNRVNRYTGLNMLADPALFLVEWFNECSAQQTAQVAWPAVWVNRDSGATAAAKTWPEWLADSSQSHGYANIAALNSAWGTAYASFEVIPAPSSNLPNLSMSLNQISVDVVRYIRYLDDAMADWFADFATRIGYTGLSSSLISFPNVVMLGNSARKSANSVVNLHDYPFLASPPGVGVSLYGGAPNAPVWDWPAWSYQSGIWTSGKPVYLGEYGWPYWGQYRNQYSILAAYAAHHGACAVTLFHEGDFFATTYDAAARDRTKTLFPYAGHGDPVARFSSVLNFLMMRAVSECAYNFQVTLNDRYYGLSPVNTGRINRSFYKLFLPTSSIPGVVKSTITWTSDTTDDSLAATLNATDWKTHLNNLLSASAITADNASLVSANENAGAITAVATSGTIGSVTASATQPVIDIGSNTLADGDSIAITNITGSSGSWPGTANRGTRAIIRQTGVGGRVQVTSGLNLTGLTGFTAGTWCELDNVIQTANNEILVSRRQKFCSVDTNKLKFFADAGSSIFPYPAMSGVVITSLTANAAIFVASLDGNAIASSSRILIGVVGDVKNLGETRAGTTDQTLTAVGTYPIQLDDVTAVVSLTVARAQEMSLYRLGLDGMRETRETPTEINAGAGSLSLTLRTGQVSPAIFWELIR